MSSFIGHSLTGTAISLQAENTPRKRLFWWGWLVVLASFPDVEYGLLWLFGVNFHLRFTHSIVFCSFLPLLTCVYLRWIVLHEAFLPLIIQACAAAYSHLVLDVLVGVYPLPLFWPLTTKLFVLPFGILPSAGKLAFTNIYLYRNALIELGILIPFYGLILIRKVPISAAKRKLLILLLVAVLIPFVMWGISLAR
jgi:membrane-bound metal-dependent hydrolase YbcI (DUF457 family)